jgi:hypothetical protein
MAVAWHPGPSGARVALIAPVPRRTRVALRPVHTSAEALAKVWPHSSRSRKRTVRSQTRRRCTCRGRCTARRPRPGIPVRRRQTSSPPCSCKREQSSPRRPICAFKHQLQLNLDENTLFFGGGLKQSFTFTHMYLILVMFMCIHTYKKRYITPNMWS